MPLLFPLPADVESNVIISDSCCLVPLPLTPPPPADIENNVIISDYAQMDRILKEERNYILQVGEP